MRIYHFLPTRHALEDIEKGRLKISRFEDLNDPFELHAAQLSQRAHREPTRSFKRIMHRRFGLLCFSEAWDSPLMWSHYADKHRGICLGVDVPDEAAHEVVYDPARLPLNLVEEGGNVAVEPGLAEKLLTTKFSQWRYERERRVILPLEEQDREGEHYFQRLDDNIALREVILGPRCDEPRERVRQLVAPYNPTVVVIKARLAFGTYRVVVDLRSIESSHERSSTE